MRYNWTNFPTIGFVSTVFTDKQLLKIKEEIDKIQNNFEYAKSNSNSLMGHIKHQYKLIECGSYIQELITPLMKAHDLQYPNYSKSITSIVGNIFSLVLDEPWVNFQKKTEFNPTHTHQGIYSFVLWIKIPYKNSEEAKVFPQFNENKRSVTGCFEFTYLDSTGAIRHHIIPVDNTYENMCILFPANMIHQVYPFYTSDEYRISVSGNFVLKG
jgi:hypothetical protein